MAHAERGAVLLEVVVALAIVAVVGTTAVISLTQALSTLGHVQMREADLEEADAYLEIMSLWPRTDLDRRLGAHPHGPWIIVVRRSIPTLYHVALIDSLSGSELLATSLYRPARADVADE